MAKPTCGDCLYWIDGRCRCDFTQDHPHAGERRFRSTLACPSFYRRGLPAHWFVGGIIPEPDDGTTTLEQLLEGVAPPDTAVIQETLEAEPYTLEQARAIRAMLSEAGKGTHATPEAVESVFRSIQEAAGTARLQLKANDQFGIDRPPYQLMTELSRVGKRGHLTDKPSEHVINALLFGAVAAGVLSAEETEALDEDMIGYSVRGLALLRALTPDELGRAADAARDPGGMLCGTPGAPEGSVVRTYVRIVVERYRHLSGRTGAPFTRGRGGRPSGPLIRLVEACLLPLAPLSREGIAHHLKAIRRDG